MKFRPCIDIHNGKVKQIVGVSLTDVQDQASENFVSEQDASFYAELYKKAGIKGGHVILLNGHDSPYYESTKEQALLALHTYSGGLQIGGGVNPENAGEYLDAGASHVIVTSYVFKDGRISRRLHSGIFCLVLFGLAVCTRLTSCRDSAAPWHRAGRSLRPRRPAILTCSAEFYPRRVGDTAKAYSRSALRKIGKKNGRGCAVENAARACPCGVLGASRRDSPSFLPGGCLRRRLSATVGINSFLQEN